MAKISCLESFFEDFFHIESKKCSKEISGFYQMSINYFRTQFIIVATAPVTPSEYRSIQGCKTHPIVKNHYLLLDKKQKSKNLRKNSLENLGIFLTTRSANEDPFR